MLDIPLLSGSRAAALDLNFLTGSLPAGVTFTRASSATDGLYTDAAASSFNTYTTDVPRMLTAGLLIEEARTQLLLNSAVPATQTTASLATGTYVFWCIGTGSVTSSAGTATASGLGAITGSQGTFQTIVVTVAGTLTFTVSGSINRFQLELGAFPTSFISSAGASATRAADVTTVATSSFAFNQNAGAFALQAIYNGATASFPRWVTDPISITFLYPNSNTSPFSAVEYNGTNLATANTTVFGAVFKAASSYSAAGRSVVLNGGAVATDATAMTAAISALAIGSGGGGGNPVGQMWFQRIRYFNQRLPDTQLQALTQ